MRNQSQTSTKKYKISVVTGSRAEYGLLYWLIHEIQNDPELELQVVTTGMHLSPEFGLSYQQIEEDGFAIHAKVEAQLSSDTAIGITKSVGLGVIGFADAYSNLKPDMVILLGDRFEILAAAQAALFAKIPIAHIHGGELTEGAFDEAIRHAITKMSYLHFVAAEPYRKRVIQLGEDPSRVFNVGAIGLDHLTRTALLDRDTLQKELDFKLGDTNFLVTYHPTTLGDKHPITCAHELFHALDQFKDTHIIFTQPNADTHGRTLAKLINDYVKKNSKRAIAFVNLGSLKYLSLLKYVDVVIGNSSSGLIEVPYFKKPTVNIGNRQHGRLRTKSILDCEETSVSITGAVKNALLKLPELQNDTVNSPYGDCNASLQIKEIIKQYQMKIKLAKKFFDINFNVI